jgi:hypothetical protein
MTITEKMARLERLRELIERMRANAHEGHTPYVWDAIEMIVDLLEKDIG